MKAIKNIIVYAFVFTLFIGTTVLYLFFCQYQQYGKYDTVLSMAIDYNYNLDNHGRYMGAR